jgi:hypothetical protein
MSIILSVTSLRRTGRKRTELDVRELINDVSSGTGISVVNFLCIFTTFKPSANKLRVSEP